MKIKELLKDYPEFEDDQTIIYLLKDDPNFKDAESATDWARETYKSHDYVTQIGDLILATHPYSVLEMLLDDYDSADVLISKKHNKQLAELSCRIFDTNNNLLKDYAELVHSDDGTADVFSNEDVCFKVATGFNDQLTPIITLQYLNGTVIERLDDSNIFELAGKINAALLDGEHEYTIYRNKITPMIVVLKNLKPVK